MAERPREPVPTADRKAFLLRLPPKLLAELKGWAAQDLRSLNGQIEFLLRDALRRAGRPEGDKQPGKKSGA